MKNKTDYPYESIKDVYNQDQKDREKMDWDSKKDVALIDKKDKERIEYARYLLDKGEITTKQDLFYAAMLFHHSENLSDLTIALSLSYLSISMGYSDGKWLYARALDRLLLDIGHPQKFGTQFEEKDGKWFLCEYKKSTTDEERKLYEVPPLDYQKNIRAKEIANE